MENTVNCRNSNQIYNCADRIFFVLLIIMRWFLHAHFVTKKRRGFDNPNQKPRPVRSACCGKQGAENIPYFFLIRKSPQR